MKNILVCFFTFVISLSFVSSIQKQNLNIKSNFNREPCSTASNINEFNNHLNEEKIYSRATVEDDFTGDSVLVVLDGNQITVMTIGY